MRKSSGEDKRTIVIEQPFAMAKYPVTNLQYKRFIDANGYNRREFWSRDGWAWRMGTYDTKATKEYEKNALAARPVEKHAEPFFWHDAKWNNPLAPVVGVCWFEAEAYCNWLAEQLGRPIRLPAEEEWERAARHTDGREYPWGNKFDRRKLNGAEFWGERDDLDWRNWLDENGHEKASTTLVGQFVEGCSPDGVSDVSGNVGGWTNSWYDSEKIHRAVRGGAWGLYMAGTRCAYRDRNIPDHFGIIIGFRLLSLGAMEDFVGWVSTDAQRING